MEIDRSNYEIWLIDYLDGKLSDPEITALNHFLSANPGIKEEFDELSLFKLSDKGKIFKHKNSLKKNPSQIPESQFEDLCSAYLENDLSGEQQAELKEIIDNDSVRKRSFDLFLKMKLSPPDTRFRYKRHLLRRTLAVSLRRISIIGLSAAAIAAIVLYIDIRYRVDLPLESVKTLPTALLNIQVQKQDTKNLLQPPKIGNASLHNNRKRPLLPASSDNRNSSVNDTGRDLPVHMDTVMASPERDNNIVKKAAVALNIDLRPESINTNLMAQNRRLPVSDSDDERSNISKFIARTFREKILREHTPKDSPLEGYELAEAGVAGLNRLFGWEMALDERKDENGKLKSVYFSSRMIKFNAPIKNSNPLQ
jgi:hypothetical protein